MESGSTPAAETRPPKLHWYQWTLRSLFLLTLLVAIGMSYVAVTMRNQRKEKAAAVDIEKAGGTVMSEPTWLGKVLKDDSLVRVTGVGLSKLSNTDALMTHLHCCKHIAGMGLYKSDVTDAGLAHLEGLSELGMLGLNSTNVTDAGLVHLEGLSQLFGLALDHTQVTDAGLVHLRGLHHLQWVLLGHTKVTDEGVEKLQQALPNCKIAR